MANTMALAVAVLLTIPALRFALGKLHFQIYALTPTCSLLLATVLPSVAMYVYFIQRPKKVYLVDYACFQPTSNFRISRATILEHAHLTQFHDDSSIKFVQQVLERSGLGDETYIPHSLTYISPCCSLDEARAEAEMVIFSAIDDLLGKTCINLDAINILLTNCNGFSPTPTLADMVTNRYKLQGDIRIINLSGMGCSAGMAAVGLASNLLQVMPSGSHALVVSTETIGPFHYAGRNRSMQLVNILFRIGGTAVLLSNSRFKARYQLAHVTRTTTVADDRSYRCVFMEEDNEGNKGVTLSKDITMVAGYALKANITTIGPLVLPVKEQLKFVLLNVVKKILHGRRIKPYIPNFNMAFEHFCIHAGGPAVINSVQHGLNLLEKHVEPSHMTFHRFGNQSTTSLWYELAYIEAKGRMQKSDRVWMIGFGSGYECNSTILVCIQPPLNADGPWASCVHRFPVDIRIPTVLT